MSSAEQQRKKDIARNESLDHHQYANVMHTRDGKDHEDHKERDKAIAEGKDWEHPSVEKEKKMQYESERKEANSLTNIGADFLFPNRHR